MLSILPASALALLLAASPAPQQVFVVAPVPGPGVFSTDIQAAVTAAASGDLVLVKAGTYSAFTIDGKSVSVVADSGANVVVNGRVFVTNLNASQSALLQGLTVNANNSTPSLVTLNCPGSIWIESCNVTGGTLNGTGLVAVSINTSPSVVIQRCVMTGGNGALGTTNGMGAPALHVANATVAVSDSLCTGGNGATPASPGMPNAGVGGPGLRVVTGATFASGCNFQGGNGAPPVPPNFPGGSAAPGINTGGAVTLLQCTPIPGISPPGIPTPPPIVLLGGTVSNLPGPARHFSTTSPVREGQTTTLTAGGAAGELAGFLVSPLPGSLVMMPQFEGALVLSFANVDGISLGMIPAGGTLATQLVVPNLPPTLQSTMFWCQSVFFDAQLNYAILGPASAVVVLNASL